MFLLLSVVVLVCSDADWFLLSIGTDDRMYKLWTDENRLSVNDTEQSYMLNLRPNYVPTDFYAIPDGNLILSYRTVSTSSGESRISVFDDNGIEQFVYIHNGMPPDIPDARRFDCTTFFFLPGTVDPTDRFFNATIYTLSSGPNSCSQNECGWYVGKSIFQGVNTQAYVEIFRPWITPCNPLEPISKLDYDPVRKVFVVACPGYLLIYEDLLLAPTIERDHAGDIFVDIGIGGENRDIYVAFWDIANQKNYVSVIQYNAQQEFSRQDFPTAKCSQIAFSPDGSLMCYEEDSHTFHFYDAEKEFTILNSVVRFGDPKFTRMRYFSYQDGLYYPCTFSGDCPFVDIDKTREKIRTIVAGSVVGVIVLIAIIIVAIVVIALWIRVCIRKQQAEMERLMEAQKKLEKFQKEIEILEMQAKDGGAKIKVNSEMFAIDFDEVDLICKIGQGGFAEVMKVEWNGQVCALKLFKVTTLAEQVVYDDFEREVNIFSSISHPGILSFYGCCLKPPSVGIVMEYCSNGDLQTYMTKLQDENREMPPQLKISILHQCASALAYLHNRNVIHRDIKCENILLNDHLQPKLIDFGLSRVVEENAKMTVRTGTSHYMAPEVTLGGGKYTCAIDVFSFAIVIFEILTEDFEPYGKVDFNIEIKVASEPSFRPQIDVQEYKEWGWLIRMMRNCWDGDPLLRPEIKEVMDSLGRHLE